MHYAFDQMINEEKSLQIGLMGSIYSRSRSTIIWLGDEDEAAGSKAAMEHLIMLCNVVQHNEKIPKTLEDENARDWVALQRLLYRSYWKRIWIVQEVLLPPKAVVYRGTLGKHRLVPDREGRPRQPVLTVCCIREDVTLGRAAESDEASYVATQTNDVQCLGR